ncbi:MAG: protein kinase [Phycisphaera sp.]|nr:protein kinase [Phycisphaera sp.]
MTADRLCSLLVQHRLIDAARCEPLRASCAGDTGVERLAEALIDQALLPAWMISTIVRQGMDSVRVGRYTLLEPIWTAHRVLGTEVYRAIRDGLGLTVAIVTLPDGAQNGTAIQRLEREAMSLASLKHPNLIQIIDCELTHDTPHLVLEYPTGQTITELMAERGRLPWQQAVDIAAQVCAGLQHLADAGLVHRGIDGDAVLLDTYGTAKIIDMEFVGYVDFGRSQLTSDAEPARSVHFCSPEAVVDLHRADIRSDLYSVGCMLHWMICGEHAIEEGGSDTETLLNILRKPPRPIETLCEGLPPELCRIVARLLAKSPSERYTTAAEVEELLRGVCRPASDPPQQERFAVFLSYRRADSQDIAGRIADHLESRFGENSVFLDVDAIPPGVDYRRFIARQLASAAATLIVIGDRWLTVADREGTPARIMDPQDPVHSEVAAALAAGVPAIPVLVGASTMPTVDQLPQPLQAMHYLNAVEVRTPHFRNHIRSLIEHLERLGVRSQSG